MKKNLNCIFEFSFSFSVLQWASVLSRVALEQERILPVLLDLLRTNSDLELRSLTGFLRNLSRHAKDKNDMCKSLFFHVRYQQFDASNCCILRFIQVLTLDGISLVLTHLFI